MLQGAVLSIQSQVAFGHVGNSAAMLPLQRLGFEVWPINTVQLAHHPGYGRWCGHRVEAERVEAILAGLIAQDVPAGCRALLSGYLGDAAMASPVLAAWQAIRGRRADAVYLCDTVIGDDGAGLFVLPEVAQAIAQQLVPAADIVTPNRFELQHLTGLQVAGPIEALAAATALRAKGPRIVVATGLPLPGEPERLGMLAAAEDGAWLVTTPRLPRPFNGTGDAFAALLLGHYLIAPDLATALARAASAMFALVETTYRLERRELALVAAQDAFASTEARFPAEPLSA